MGIPDVLAGRTSWWIETTDVLAGLATIPDKSIQSICTSPPYWSLRSYSTTPQIWGGDPNCTHIWNPPMNAPTHVEEIISSVVLNTRAHDKKYPDPFRNSAEYQNNKHLPSGTGAYCTICRAWYGELGSEPTTAQFIENMRLIFRELWRVLRDDGTIFLNIADSYIGSGKGKPGPNAKIDHSTRQGFTGGVSGGRRPSQSRRRRRDPAYGTGDTGQSGSPGPDSAYPDLCDGCRDGLLNHHDRTVDTRRPPQRDEQPSGMADHDTGHPVSVGGIVDGVHPAVQGSTSPESEPPLPGECSHCANCGACLAVLRSSSRDARLCARRAGNTLGSEMSVLAGRTAGKDALGMAYRLQNNVQPQYTMRAKSLALIPERLAIMLADEGWIIRSRIAWCKLSALPESVGDRPSASWEHIFLLAKSQKYFYDQDAVRQPHADTNVIDGRYVGSGTNKPGYIPMTQAWDGSGIVMKDRDHYNELGANLRNVWLLPPEPNSDAWCTACQTLWTGTAVKRVKTQMRTDSETGEKTPVRICPCGGENTILGHFATFLTEIPRRAILAGTSLKGACPECGVAWHRVVERTRVGSYHNHAKDGEEYGLRQGGQGPASTWTPPKTIDWVPGCKCTPVQEPIPCTVLDPFSGSGTTALVAYQLGRRAIGLELNPQYAAASRARIGNDAPLFAGPF